MTVPLPACWDPAADCLFDDAAGECPCRSEEPAVERDTVTVPTGEYL